MAVTSRMWRSKWVAGNAIWYYVSPSGSTLLNPVAAVFNRVATNSNGNHGVLVDGRNTIGAGNLKTTVSDSIAARNGKVGFFALTVLGPTVGDRNVMLMLVRSVAANNLYGLDASGGNTRFHVANSTVVGNTYGWVSPNYGELLSYADNYIDDNDANEDAPPTVGRK